MSKPFRLMVLTPEREFYNGEAYSVSVQSIDGQLCVLADHIPMTSALGVGTLTIKRGEEALTAFHSEGFMEVRSDGVIVLCQACEWPEEIDLARAQEAQKRAWKRMLEQAAPEVLAHSRVALMRAMTRIKVKSMQNRNS